MCCKCIKTLCRAVLSAVLGQLAVLAYVLLLLKVSTLNGAVISISLATVFALAAASLIFAVGTVVNMKKRTEKHTPTLAFATVGIVQGGLSALAAIVATAVFLSWAI